jgi:hypothetical protein
MAIGRISGQMLKSNLLRSGTDLAFETNLLVLDVTNSFVGIGTATPARQLHISGTGAIRLPSGTDAQRGTPANGDIRYNTDQSRIEGYSNGAWANLASGSSIKDQDTNTGIDVERTSNENQIHFFTESSGDVMHIRDNGDVEFGGLLFDLSAVEISSLTTNGNIAITPNGTGEVDISKVDIAAGEIDGTTIGANSAAAGSFTTLTTSGNATIGGNLTVNGTTTTIDSVTLTIEDPLLELAKNNSGGDANTYDQGLLFNRGSDDNVSFLWDETADEFVFAVTSGEDGTTAGNVTIDSYAALQAGIVRASTELKTGVIKADDGTAAMTIADSTGQIDVTAISLHSEVIRIDVDSKALTIGASNDLSLVHDGTNSIISNSTGDLQITGVASSAVVFNEGGADIDLRVEGDTDTDLFVVDASADQIGISTAAGSIGYVLDASGSTDAFRLPSGDTSQRPTAATGIIRFNTQTGKYEGCQDGSTYTEFATAGDVPVISKVSATGDGSTQTFTGFFASAPASVANILVFIDNVYQEPTENYSVSSNNITFTSAPHSGARIFAIVGFDNTALASGGVVRTETSAVSFTSSATTIMSFNATSYRAAECFIITTDSGNTEYEVAKALLVHDGTTAYVTVYGQTSSTGSDLSTYSATLSGGAVLLQAVSAGGTQTAKVQYSLSSV